MKRLLLLLPLVGCAAPQAHRFVDDYADARADGAIDASEMRTLDRDAADLDDALRAPPIPPTGFPWIDVVAPLVAAAPLAWAATSTQ